MTKVFKFREVGYLGQSWGVEGGLKFKGLDEVFARILELGLIFIRHADGSPVPYVLTGAEQKGDFVIYLEGIDLPEEARQLSGRPILLEETDVPDQLWQTILKGESGLHPWTGFTILDQNSGQIYRILRVEQYPQQEMAVLENEVLIPLHEDMIQIVDEVGRQLKMDLPEGLFEE